MKHIKTYRLFESRNPGDLTPEQIAFLDKGCKSTQSTWGVSSVDGVVNVLGSFDCQNMGLTKLPAIPWGRVDDFVCSNNPLISLENSPRTINGSFMCDNTNIPSLEGGPTEVGEFFYCSGNKNLTSLNGLPLCLGFECDQISLDLSINGHDEEPLDKEGALDKFMELILSSDSYSLTSEKITLIISYLMDNHKGISWKIEVLRSVCDKVRTIMATTFMDEKTMDNHFRNNPMDLDLLDKHPEIKAGVLQRTGLRDMSGLARSIRKGLI